MFCVKCGTKIIEQSKFCVNCGESVEGPAQGADEVAVATAIQPVSTPEAATLEQPEYTPVSASADQQSAPALSSVMEAKQTEYASEALSEIVPVQAKRNMNKWWYIGIASVLVFAMGAGGFYWLMSSGNDKQKQAVVSQNAGTPSPTANTVANTLVNPIPKGIEHLYVDQIDLSQYPSIKFVIDVGKTDALDLSPKEFNVAENNAVQAVKSIEKVDGSKIAVSYETKITNANPGSADKRTVALAFLDKKADSGYEAPLQQALKMGDISYNTDQYPKVKLYFSLYDSNSRLMDNAPSDVSLFNINENDKPLQVSEVAKMSDAKESLSTNVVIDVSSSMSDKIDRVKQAASQFLTQSNVTPNDRIAFMSFAGASEIKQYSFSSDKSSVASQVSSLVANGKCTALYRALEEAVYNTAYNGMNGSKYVVLFTDGGENCSNEGITSQDTVNPETVINSAIQMGVPIYAVGISQDNQLQHIAKETKGEYVTIGSDIQQLGRFYESIYSKKKAQYVVSYTSEIPQKAPRNTGIILNAPKYYSKLQVPVTPRLVDDQAVIKSMALYQMNWSAAMSSGNMSYLNPYVVVDSSSPTSVYGIVSEQVKSLNEAKQTGNYSKFDIPIYQMLDATKVSATHYQLQVQKRVKRTIINNSNVTASVFKETAYTYNVLNQNGKWLVDSTVESEVPEVCYADQTYSQVIGCK